MRLKNTKREMGAFRLMLMGEYPSNDDGGGGKINDRVVQEMGSDGPTDAGQGSAVQDELRLYAAWSGCGADCGGERKDITDDCLEHEMGSSRETDAERGEQMEDEHGVHDVWDDN